jgi:hypothetical protein
MAAWTADVAEPFATDRDFAASVGASADALLALVVATALTLLLGILAAVAFAVPIALLLRAGMTGRASARRNKAAFASQEEWKAAERQAVAQVFGKALVRRRFG